MARRRLTGERREQLLQAVRIGSSREQAAALVGIDADALSAMIEASPALAKGIATAEATAEVSQVGVIAKASKGGDWRAAALLLGMERRYCGARSKRTGDPCRMVKGFRTDHPGVGKCWLHGGRTPSGKKFAQIEAAENALAALGIADSVDPVASLFEAVSVAAWRELGLRQMLQARTALYAPDHMGNERPDVVAVMHQEALEQRAKIAKMAIDAGLDERIVRLAERQGEVIHRVLTVALDAAGVTGEARQTAEDAVIRELAAVGPSGDELN